MFTVICWCSILIAGVPGDLQVFLVICSVPECLLVFTVTCWCSLVIAGGPGDLHVFLVICSVPE